MGERPEEPRAGAEPEGHEAEPEPVDWDRPLPPLPSDGEPAGESAAPPVVPELPRWATAEVAWPLALAAGFLGAAAGLQSEIPGTGALFPALLFAPLFLGLLSRGRPRLAAVLAVGWTAAVGAGSAGSVLELDWTRVAAAAPGAAAFRDSELLPRLAEGSAGGEWPWLRNLVVAALVVVLARPTAGFLSLLVLAAASSAMGAGLGWLASEATGTSPELAVLYAVPPHRALAIAGLALVVTGLAGRRSALSERVLEDLRLLLLLGGALAALGLTAEPWLADLWGRALTGVR